MAGTVQEWAVEKIESVLVEATDQNRDTELSVLREAAGIGHDDLMATLDKMREWGRAVEEAPGLWRAPYEDEQPPDAVPSVPLEDGELPRGAVSEFLRPGEQAAERKGYVDRQAAVETRLSAKQVGQLDDAAVGALVKAGLVEGQQFVLRIDP